MSEQYKASKFLEENDNYSKEELLKIFEDSEEDDTGVYLCKRCKNDITSSEEGLCIGCIEVIEDSIDFEYIYDYYMDIPNIELENDLI